jgi:hypothetical protein
MTNKKIPPCPVCGKVPEYGRWNLIEPECRHRAGVDFKNFFYEHYVADCNLLLGRSLRAHGIETVAQVDSLKFISDAAGACWDDLMADESKYGQQAAAYNKKLHSAIETYKSIKEGEK